MKNLSVKIIVAILILLSLISMFPTKTSTTLSFESGENVYVMFKHHLNGTMDVTVKVDNGWVDIPLLDLFDPVMVTISTLDKNGRKIVEIPYRYKDFINKQASKRVPLKYVEFLQSKQVYAEVR